MFQPHQPVLHKGREATIVHRCATQSPTGADRYVISIVNAKGRATTVSSLSTNLARREARRSDLAQREQSVRRAGGCGTSSQGGTSARWQSQQPAQSSIFDLLTAVRRTVPHFFAGIGGWPPRPRPRPGWPREREVWTASLPCQPISVAGKREGAEDERHLWPVFYRFVRERRPAVIFGEQVASKDGREWLAAVRADLEAIGYAVGAACLPACSVGAPHRRYRLFWVAHRAVAHRSDKGREGRLSGRANPVRQAVDRHAGHGGAAGRMADAAGGQRRRLTGAEGRESDGQAGGWLESDGVAADDSAAGLVADAARGRREQWDAGERGLSVPDARGANDGMGDANGFDQPEIYAGVDSLDQQRAEDGRRTVESAGSGTDGGTRSGDHSARRGGIGTAREMGNWADADWLWCRDEKYRPVEPGTFPLAHGLSGRVGRLRAYGNAIVPQVAAEFIAAYLEEHPE